MYKSLNFIIGSMLRIHSSLSPLEIGGILLIVDENVLPKALVLT